MIRVLKELPVSPNIPLAAAQAIQEVDPIFGVAILGGGELDSALSVRIEGPGFVNCVRDLDVPAELAAEVPALDGTFPPPWLFRRVQGVRLDLPEESLGVVPLGLGLGLYV